MVEQISANELADWIDEEREFTLIDTRPADSYEAWHVRGAENVPFDPREGLSDEDVERVKALVDSNPVVTMCGKGLTSTPFGFELDQRGYDERTSFWYSAAMSAAFEFGVEALFEEPSLQDIIITPVGGDRTLTHRAHHTVEILA